MNFRYFHACQLPFVVACITSVFTLTALAQTPAAPATPTTPATPAAATSKGTPAAAAPVNAGPYVPSPETAVAELLKLANIGPNDVVIDLGSGDGRIVLTAAKVYGARGFGVEIQENLVKLSTEAAKKEGLAERVKFINQDLFKTDISSATVLTMYLLPDTVNMLSPKLQKELKPGTRILSHDYPLAGWQEEMYRQFDLEEKVQISGVKTTVVYLYIVPARVGGQWNARVSNTVLKESLRLELRQEFQKISGIARIGAREVPLEELKLRGTELTFRIPVERSRSLNFRGEVNGVNVEGMVELSGTRTPWSAALVK